MADLTANVKQLSIETRAFQQEMREFKDEMREFKDEMREFKDEMREFKDEMREFKDEMREFKDEMREFKDKTDRYIVEMRNESREMNRRWGDISNSLGMLVENIVAPSIPRVLQEVLGCPDGGEQFLTVRYKSVQPDGRTREFDAIAGCGDFLLINETKSRLGPSDIDSFIEVLKTARDFLPQYAERKIVGALATLYLDPSLVTAGEHRGLLMLGMTDQAMEVLNSKDFHPSVY
ncbi:MAG: hypothetical protein KDH89_00125 [Anaerolineae bacterium]|nr:hypothetical protein [Anaerolineae bacterium]